jgi:hypothetical protein
MNSPRTGFEPGREQGLVRCLSLPIIRHYRFIDPLSKSPARADPQVPLKAMRVVKERPLVELHCSAVTAPSEPQPR